jgi:hypothetical protein
VPGTARSRRVWWLAGVLIIIAIAISPFGLRGREILRPLRRMLGTRLLNPVPSSSTPSRPPVPEATLERQREGLAALVAEAEAGDLFPDAPDRVLVLVDQGLIQRLLTALTPSEHVIADRYHVVITGARVVFEDGFALVRLDGRASFANRTCSRTSRSWAIWRSPPCSSVARSSTHASACSRWTRGGSPS